MSHYAAGGYHPFSGLDLVGRSLVGGHHPAPANHEGLIVTAEYFPCERTGGVIFQCKSITGAILESEWTVGDLIVNFSYSDPDIPETALRDCAGLVDYVWVFIGGGAFASSGNPGCDPEFGCAAGTPGSFGSSTSSSPLPLTGDEEIVSHAGGGSMSTTTPISASVTLDPAVYEGDPDFPNNDDNIFLIPFADAIDQTLGGIIEITGGDYECYLEVNLNAYKLSDPESGPAGEIIAGGALSGIVRARNRVLG